MRKVTAMILVITLLLPFSVYASKIDTKKKELKGVKTSIEESKKELKEKTQEIVGVQGELKTLDQVIVDVENELLEINEKLEIKEGELEVSEEQLEIAKEAKEVQYENGKERIESMYKNQKVGYIQVIFTSKSFWEMLNRMEYIRKIAQYDQTMLENMKQKEEEIAVRTEQLEAEKQSISLLYKEQIGVKSRLDITREEKDKALARLEKDEEGLQSQIKNMIKISEDIEKEVKRLTQQSKLQYTGGKFLWPVPGNNRISSSYDNRIHPITGKYKFHTGIDIPASYGKAVVAAADGKVITAGWMNGYGNTVMIDHGSGFVTLYGHNSSLTVSVGTMVKRGGQVAKIGSTGNSTGNHCHFEVRLKGAHKNPINYLK
ncbi:MAG TPA: peptidoglycan DD-metalloendopeptidase family protein [Epulopiscium sp.]|nr:peptidoglycan DD-metalloendopeptidase family protein [Candidatus Epulonipiscium sp.]